MPSPDPTTSDPAGNLSDLPPMWSQRNVRFLKIAVAGMGALIVVGLVVVLVTIIGRISAGPAPEPATVATVLPVDVARLFGADSEVVSTWADGNRLALVLKRPEGLAVVVVDLRSGRILNVISGE
jgi:hypothetical protein